MLAIWDGGAEKRSILESSENVSTRNLVQWEVSFQSNFGEKLSRQKMKSRLITVGSILIAVPFAQK